MRRNGPEDTRHIVRPHRPRGHRDGWDARHRSSDRRGLRLRGRQGRRGQPQGRRLHGDRGVPDQRVGRRGARRAHPSRRARRAPGPRRRDRRPVRSPRYRRQQRRQRAHAAARCLYARGLGEVVRREPAGAGLPRPGRAAPPEGKPVRGGREPALRRRVPPGDECADVLRGQGRNARVHPVRWRANGHRSVSA